MLRNRNQQEQDTPALRVVALVAAAGGGALAQYLLDPVSGRTRRAQLAERSGAAVRRRVRGTAEQAATKAQVARDKAVGTVRGMVTSSEPPPNDQALVDRIRSQVLGAEEFRGFTINVDSADGNVTLRGEARHPDEVEALEQAVRQVPGVREVTNFVHLPGTDPENIREPMEASRGGRGPRPS